MVRAVQGAAQVGKGLVSKGLAMARKFSEHKEKRLQKLQEKADQGDKLALLISQPGWRVVLDRIQGQSEDSYEAWLEKGQEAAEELRLETRALYNLVNWVTSEIAAGRKAREALLRYEEGK